jgi:aspartate/methionine/tyrosine aminotransferase
MPAVRALRDFALEVHFSKWEFEARYNLAASDAESFTIEELLALASQEERAAFQRLHLGYTQTRGDPQLREAIAGTYDTCKAADIICFAGAEEAIYVAARTLLQAGDHAIAITPNYQSAETIPLSVCEVSGVPLDPERGWRLDVELLRRAIRPNTRLISINFPNNPTGCIAERETLDEIVALCRARGIWLFSDEVYRLFERDPGRRLPQAVDLYERAISLNVMSKPYGLPGLRIGWLACKDADVLRRFERYKHYLSICNSGPSEQLALIALRVRERLLERNRGIVDANLRRLDAFFAGWKELFDWQVPDGGCVGFIRYLGADGVEAFTRQLVEDSGVLLLPASLFRSQLTAVPNDRFRIGYGRAAMGAGLDAWQRWLEDRRAR